jgi:hypothetical protein
MRSMGLSFGTAFGVAVCLLMSACGGGGGGGLGSSGSSGGSGSTPSGANVASIIVDQGPNNDSVNTAFVSVTVCAAGSTTNCATVDHVQLDTGSYGLRILSSALNLALQPIAAPGGGSLVECVNFVDGYSWGPVVAADVTVGGETAGNLPVHVIGDSRFTTVPSDCSGTGTEEDTVATFHANGVLGVGPFQYDCGDGCVSTVQPASYYACNGASCIASTAPLASQVQSFVASLASDNNGVIIQMPSVADAGALTVSGSLIFGIDTESNNASGSETVIALDGFAELTATYKGQALNQSFIDSGTNGIYFNDSTIPKCTQTGITDFYCPTSTQALSAALTSNVMTGTSAMVDFSVGNANDMFQANPTFNAFPQLSGSYPGTTPTLDLGMSFFYGRRVAVALDGAKTTVGTGPYVAF